MFLDIFLLIFVKMTKLFIQKKSCLTIIILCSYWRHIYCFLIKNTGLTDEELLVNITIPLNTAKCYLIGNDLTRIYAGYFVLPNLWMLQMHWNKISEIDDESFIGKKICYK